MRYYRPSVKEDYIELAPNLRKEDVIELELSAGMPALYCLESSFECSIECNSIIHPDGSVIGMFGISSNSIFTVPWMLVSDRLPEIRRKFVPQAQEWVERISDEHPLLLNYVHAENRPALRWLKSLGFTTTKLEPEYGAGKAPFYQFVRVKSNV